MLLGRQPYEQVCQVLDRAIATQLGLPTPSSADQGLIKDADNKALMIEAADLLPDRGAGIAETTALPMESRSWAIRWTPTARASSSCTSTRRSSAATR